jgi:hypothetical protein
MRRWTAVVATVLLVLEAGASLLVALVLGKAANVQHMRLGGLSTAAIADGAYIGLSVQTAFLLLVAALLVRVVIRAAAPGRPTRVVLVAAAVFHGILAALMLALSGVLTFLVAAVTLTLLVLILFIPPSGSTAPQPALAPTEPAAPAV